MDGVTIHQRVCARCKQAKPASPEAFRKTNQRGRPGLSAWCRACYTVYSRERYVHKRLPLVERFWSRVNKSGPVLVPEIGNCWVWLGRLSGDGYGGFCINGKTHRAHRVAFLIHHGRWPDPCALHKCDGGVIGCVRWDHLFEGTQSENVADMINKGRRRQANVKGERHGNSKLTTTDVLAIRAALARGETQASLALQFGVTAGLVWLIGRRRIWKHV